MEETNEMSGFSTEAIAEEMIEPRPVAEPEPIKKTRKHFSRLGLFLFLGSVIVTIVQIVPAAMVSVMKPDLLYDSNAVLLLALIPMYLS